MLVVALTGGIGSGKSTVAKLFAEHGVPIIDTDVIAKEITQPDMPAFLHIKAHFPPSIVTAGGTLDRAQLREIIFHDATERRWLEGLLHPLIRKEMEEQIKKNSAPYCIVVIPLLFEVEFYSVINRILVVDTPEQIQIDRVTLRDKVSTDQVKAILASQALRHDRVARAHDVILNDGILADLIPQVDKLHQLYTQLGMGKN